MRFSTWEPAYRAILTDFGYGADADRLARDQLAAQLGAPGAPRVDFEECTVAIAGGGPSLPAELGTLREADRVVAASVAADVCLDRGIAVDMMVTDLDKNPETAVELTRAGTPVAIHAHGDNRPLLEDHVPSLDPTWTIPTTQAAPEGPVVNYGGFTDGDRAAFIADHLGAERLVFAGWDFDDPSVDASKARKLEWAARLLRWLERRRETTFALLDDRRGRLSLSWL
jgi:uncharacterized Rossmann fold enzyme